MSVRVERCLETVLESDQVGRALTEWALKEGFSRDSESPGHWAFKRGKHLDATMSLSSVWDIKLIPTTVSVDLVNERPCRLQCSMVAGSPLAPFATKGKVEKHFQILVGALQAREVIGAPVAMPARPDAPRTDHGEQTRDCPGCGASTPAAAKFCTTCGKDMTVKPASPACPECNAQVPETAKFCQGCGAALSGPGGSR